MKARIIRLFFLGLFLIFGLSATIAQNSPCEGNVECDSCQICISGYVNDLHDGNALTYAVISLDGYDKNALTDANGFFSFPCVCPRSYNLHVNYMGYKDTTTTLSIIQDTTIYLTPEVHILELPEVTISHQILERHKAVSLPHKHISSHELTGSTTRTLADAISSIQGVSFSSNGNNVKRPIIHGLSGNRILIINNGIKHGFQNWGSDHAPEIDISATNHITVLKGASSVRYGPEALGGTIVVHGDSMRLSKPLYGNLNTGYQSNGKGYQSSMNIGKGGDQTAYYIGGSYSRIGDQKSPHYMLTNSGKKEFSLNTGFRYFHKNLDVKFRYNFVNQELGLLRSSVAESLEDFKEAISAKEPLYIDNFSYNILEPKQLINHHLFTASVKWHAPFGDFTFRLGKQLNLRKEFDVRRNAELPIINLNLETEDLQLEWNHPYLHQFKGTIGLAYFSQDNDNIFGTNTTPLIPNYNTRRLGVYIIEHVKKDKTTYEIGLRWDYEYNSTRGREASNDIFTNEYTFSNVTTNIGLTKSLSGQWSFRSHIGSAWRAPNMAELYSFGQHGFKNSYGLWRHYIDNDGELKTKGILDEESGVVKPEKGIKWISEIEGTHERQSLAVTTYANLIYNYTYLKPAAMIGTVRGPMPAFIFDQADAAFIGFDFTYLYEIDHHFDINAGLSYLWSKDIRNQQPLINQPPTSTDLSLHYHTNSFRKVKNSTIAISTSYTFKQFLAPQTITPEELESGETQIDLSSEIFDFKDAPESYWLAHISWQGNIKKIGWKFEIQNVFNTSYRSYLNELRYFADDIGRNYNLTLNYRL